MSIVNFRILCLAVAVVIAGCSGKEKDKETGAGKKLPAAQDMTPGSTPEMDPSFKVDMVLEAALNGDMQAVEEALDEGFDVDATDQELHTPLMLAAYNGHAGIVELLLDHGAKVDERDMMNRTALMYASTGPFNETVTKLLNAGADPNLVDSEEHFSALMFAAAEGQADVVSTLLEHGADKHLQDVDGETAYDFAINNGHEKVAGLVK